MSPQEPDFAPKTGVGSRVKAARKLAPGLTQEALAQRMHVSASLIKKVEQGRAPATPAFQPGDSFTPASASALGPIRFWVPSAGVSRGASRVAREVGGDVGVVADRGPGHVDAFPMSVTDGLGPLGLRRMPAGLSGGARLVTPCHQRRYDRGKA